MAGACGLAAFPNIVVLLYGGTNVSCATLPTFDQFQFAGRRNLAVSAEVTADGWQSTGISFDDYSRMHTEHHKQAASRRSETPAWAVNDNQLRAVIVKCVELRAQFRKPQTGTDRERLERAEKSIADRLRPNLLAQADRLCAQYVELKKAVGPTNLRVLTLGRKIEETDTQLRMLGNVALFYTGCVYRYYRLGEDSPEVAKGLGIKPPHVRRILWKMHEAAGELGYITRNRKQIRPATIAKREAVKAERAHHKIAKTVVRMRAAGKTWNEVKARLGDNGPHNHRWRVLVQSCGLIMPAPRNQRFGTKEQAQQAAALHKEGVSYTCIGQQLGVAPQVVRNLLRRHRLYKYTDRTKAAHRGRVDVAEAARLRADGWTFKKIGKHFRVTEASAYYALRRYHRQQIKPGPALPLRMQTAM